MGTLEQQRAVANADTGDDAAGANVAVWQDEAIQVLMAECHLDRASAAAVARDLYAGAFDQAIGCRSRDLSGEEAAYAHAECVPEPSESSRLIDLGLDWVAMYRSAPSLKPPRGPEAPTGSALDLSAGENEVMIRVRLSQTRELTARNLGEVRLLNDLCAGGWMRWVRDDDYGCPVYRVTPGAKQHVFVRRKGDPLSPYFRAGSI